MENSNILSAAETALQNRIRVKMDLKNGETKKAWILNILNNRFLIIKERRFLVPRFTVLELREIMALRVSSR